MNAWKKVRCPLGGKRGKLTSAPERQKYIEWINEAIASGARKHLACNQIGLTLRTYQRWLKDTSQDKRTTTVRPEPPHKLSEQEKQKVIDCCLSDEFADLPPSQIVPTLADRGEYIASESSFYRVLKEKNLSEHRGRAKKRKQIKAQKTFRLLGVTRDICKGRAWFKI